MKLSSPLQNSSFEIKEGRAFSLVIENKRLYRTYLENLYFQSSGSDGELVLSYDNAPVPFERNVCIIDAFVPFNINTKHMLSCISSAAEKKAVDEEHFMQTSKILAEIESYVYDLCFDFPFSVQCRKLSAASLIKSLQLCVADDYSSTLEALMSFLEVITEFDGRKLFVTVNMASYFSEEEMELFVKSVEQKQLYVLMLDSFETEKPGGVDRLIIDNDFCEI